MKTRPALPGTVLSQRIWITMDLWDCATVQNTRNAGMWQIDDKALKPLNVGVRLARVRGQVFYLVGGILRDRLMGRPCSDFDFALRDAAAMSRQFAKAAGGTRVPLDTTPGRETFRVVLDKTLTFDFSELCGSTIEEDLAARDFTINAMAMPLNDFLQGKDTVLDPHGGKEDIRSGRVRMVADSAFKSDPLRLLRAFRFAMQLDFKIEADTIDRIARDREAIGTVAPERIWQEWKLFLYEGRVFCLLRLMDKTGLLAELLPELEPLRGFHADALDARETGLRAIKELQNVLFPEGKKISEFPSPVLDREHKALLLLGALLSGLQPARSIFKTPAVPPNAVPDLLKRLRASNAESAWIDRSLGCCREFCDALTDFAAPRPDRTRLYRFVKRWENELEGGLAIAWAIVSTLPQTGSISKEACLQAARTVKDFFHEDYLPAIRKEPLLKGKDLIERFELTPSPLFSDILERVEEERVLGTIRTVEEAERTARKWIENQG